MTTYTLTHNVHGTKVRYQLSKTANDTKFMTIENGPQGPQWPQGPQGATGLVSHCVFPLRVYYIKLYLSTNYEQIIFFRH